MKKCLIFPWARLLKNGKENPKNYPFWNAVVHQLRARGYFLTQISEPHEKELDVDERLFGLKMAQIKDHIVAADTFVSIDSFAPHLANYYKKHGVVIFGKSDPLIFGYEANSNLLKDRKYLRTDQFEIWEKEGFENKVFVSPEIVVAAVEERCKT